MLRDAIGPAALTNIAFQSNISLGNILSNVTVVSDCSLVNGTCEYGLLNDKGVRIDSKDNFKYTCNIPPKKHAKAMSKYNLNCCYLEHLLKSEYRLA